MARLSATFALLITAAVCAACSSAATDTGNAPVADSPSGEVGCAAQAGLDSYAAGLEKQGDSGRYGFELVSTTPAPPALDDNTFVVRVTDSDGKPVAGELGVALDMPQHGHSSPKQPVIRFDAKSHTFTLDPMDLFMVGLWRITFSFTPNGNEDPSAAVDAAGSGSSAASAGDSAVFEFCIE